MAKEINAPLSMRTTAYFKVSLTSFAVCCALNAGMTFAEPIEKISDAFHATAGYPLLADSRVNNWNYAREQAKSKSDHRRESGNRVKERGHKDRRDWKEPKHRDHRVSKERVKDPGHYRHPHSGYQRFKPRFVPPKHRHSRDRVIVHPFRYTYPHPRHHLHRHDLWGVLAFTAITVTILDNLNDQQQREHELALYNATTTPLGETIFWRDGNASGRVTPTQEGTSNTGRYCREFRHEVTIGGDRETVYGTACQNPDGSWEIVQ